MSSSHDIYPGIHFSKQCEILSSPTLNCHYQYSTVSLSYATLCTFLNVIPRKRLPLCFFHLSFFVITFNISFPDNVSLLYILCSFRCPSYKFKRKKLCHQCSLLQQLLVLSLSLLIKNFDEFNYLNSESFEGFFFSSLLSTTISLFSSG